MSKSLNIHVLIRCQLITDTLITPQNIHLDDQQNLAKHTGRRQEQLISRSLRRQTLANHLKVDPWQLRFSVREHGKPYLADYPQLEFSQSHTQSTNKSTHSLEWLMVANQQGVAVGADIEAKKRVTALESLAKHILTAAEYFTFKHATDQQGFLLQCWTVKEAVLKASGLGIRINLNTLETGCIFNDQGWVDHPKIGQWRYQCFENEQAYYAVAWQANEYDQVIFVSHQLM